MSFEYTAADGEDACWPQPDGRQRQLSGRAVWFPRST